MTSINDPPKYSTWTSAEKHHHMMELVTEYEEALVVSTNATQKMRDIEVEIRTLEKEML